MYRKLSVGFSLLFLLLGVISSAYAYPDAGGVDVLTTTLVKPLEVQSDESKPIIGVVERMSEDTLVVDGQVLKIDDKSTIGEGVKVGAVVLVERKGTTVVSAAHCEHDDLGEYKFVLGPIEDISEGEIVVDGATFDAIGLMEGNLRVGTYASVIGQDIGNGRFIALHVESWNIREKGENLTVAGRLEAIAEDSLIVDGTIVAIDPNTVFEGEMAEGDVVHIEAVNDTDGNVKAVYVGYFMDPSLFGEPTIGVVEYIDNEMIIIDGASFLVAEYTQFVGDVKEGSFIFLLAQDHGREFQTAVYAERYQ